MCLFPHSLLWLPVLLPLVSGFSNCHVRAGIKVAGAGLRPSFLSSDDGDAEDWPLPPLRFEVSLEAVEGVEGRDGEGERPRTIPVVLTGPDTVESAVELAVRDAGGAAAEPLRELFQQCWAGHAAAMRQQQAELRAEARTYDGPRPRSMATHRRSVAATVPVPGRGLVLEVATSTVPGAGRGLFLRPASSRGGSIWQVRGSAFCGYAGGRFADRPGDDAHRRDRAFEFRLDDGVESSVWFRGELTTVGDVVARTGATRLVGHALEFSQDGGRRTLEGVRPREEEEEPRRETATRRARDGGAFRYFVPHDGGSGHNDLTIRTLGQMANDLAGGADVRDEEAYRARSRAANALVLVPQIQLLAGTDAGGEEGGGVLRPSGGPILTVRDTLRIDAERKGPMEVGCEYGYHYWAGEEEGR